MKQSRRIGSRFFMLLVFLFLYLPIFVLIVFSFNASKSRSVWSGFTLDWYKELFQNSMILDALWVTLAVSILAAVISTIIGTAAAIGFTNFRRRSRTVVTTINNIPLTNADIITGVSMMLLFVLALGALNGLFGGLGLRLRLRLLRRRLRLRDLEEVLHRRALVVLRQILENKGELRILQHLHMVLGRGGVFGEDLRYGL